MQILRLLFQRRAKLHVSIKLYIIHNSLTPPFSPEVVLLSLVFLCRKRGTHRASISFKLTTWIVSLSESEIGFKFSQCHSPDRNSRNGSNYFFFRRLSCRQVAARVLWVFNHVLDSAVAPAFCFAPENETRREANTPSNQDRRAIERTLVPEGQEMGELLPAEQSHRDSVAIWSV